MWNDPILEITMQRRAERVIEAQCAVMDAVAQYVIDRDVFSQETLRGAIAMVIERFGGGPILPDAMVAQLAGRQINVERQRREIIKKLPPPQRKDRFGRSIQPKADVVSSRHH